MARKLKESGRAPATCMFSYERVGEVLRIKAQGMTNHELRDILTGLWAALDQDDREDHINELTHHEFDEDAYLSGIADAIKSNVVARLRRGPDDNR